MKTALGVFAATVIVLPLVVIVMFMAPEAEACTPGGGDIASVNAPIGPPVNGQVRVAAANLPARYGGIGGFNRSMGTLLRSVPDVILLNEVGHVPLGAMSRRGYQGYRSGEPAPGPGGNQARNVAVMWNAKKWQKLDAGRIKLVDDDRAFLHGRKFVHDRFATWIVMRRKSDGAIVSAVSTHMMTNPAKFPRQWGNRSMARTQRYARGMDILNGLVSTLQAHGPVVIGGDFNAHPGQGPWTPVAKLGQKGFNYAKDRGVMYTFYPRSARKVGAAQVRVSSDHPALVTTLDMKGSGPKGQAGTPVRSASTDTGGGNLDLTPDQMKNARLLVSKGIQAGGKQAALVGVITALTESGMRTDPGSLGGAYGIMQQTPPWWGTLAQVKDPNYAIPKFYSALMKVPGWQTKQPWEAAQAVQNSGAGNPASAYYKREGLTWGYGGNYRVHLKQAQKIVAALGGGVVDAATDGCPDKPGAGADPAAAGNYESGGNFRPSKQPYVGPFNRGQLFARMQKFIAANGTGRLDPFFNSQSGSWYQACQHFVANLSGRAYSGYYSAATGWSSMVARGAAHPANSADGMAPPPGAWLYYDNSGPYGHVVVYLGNNQVAGTDTWGSGKVGIGPASDLTGGKWHLNYLGWSTPWGQ